MSTLLDATNDAAVTQEQPIGTDRLAVIVPVYNEERTVAELLRRLEAQPCVSQIIIVDDGSTDRTWEELEPWRTRASFTAALIETGVHLPSVIVVQHNRNRGKGRAIRTGLGDVTCSHVIIQDADLEYDPSDINNLWAVMQSGEANVVFGSRYLQNPKLQKGRWAMQSGVRFLNLLVRLLYGIKLTDEATCYKMFRTADLRAMNLQCERFEFCPEVVAKISLEDLAVVEFPIHYRARERQEGKKLTVLDAVSAIRQLICFHPKLSWCRNTRFQLVAKPVFGLCIVVLLSSFVARWLGTSETVLSQTSEKGRPGTTNETFDLGITTPGSTISRDIEIPNTTAIAWNIIGNTTTCGCTKVVLASPEIPPGTFLKGRITVKSPLVRGPYTVGVQFNAVDGPVVGATIQGSVAPSFSIVPSTLRISNDAVNSVRFDAALFTAKRLAVQSAPAWCVVSMSEPDDSSVVGALTVRPGSDPSVSRTGKLIVSDEHGFRQSIDVRLDSARDFSVVPTVLHFGEIKADTTHSKALVVQLNNRSSEASWPGISCPDAEIRIEVAAGNGVMRATVSVCESRPGIHSHDITLVHKGKSVSIPVLVKVID
ncbi:MAG: glycosyltransferase [Planctomycetota bacterium]|jgi:hypothetical protein|nr:MAG: glycosyltransferase [Planctomycetota bacterium]